MNKNSHETAVIAEEAPPVLDRPDVPGGFWNRAWPILALAIISLLLVRACLPAAPPTPPFDTAAAVKNANDKALAALAALGPEATADAIVPALNLAVVNFATGSATIPTDAEPVLAKAGAAIALLPPEIKLEVGGHTDDTGAVESNAELSQKRAEAVVAFLMANGVPAERLSARGHGAGRPIASNTTEEGRFRNRRIEFSLPQP